MVLRIINFIKRPTSLNVIINTLGNYLNVFFTALFALILVRILDPSQYGVLSVLLGIAYVLANLLDFGTTATIYSYLPPMIEHRHANRYRFIKSVFFYQSVLSFIAIALLFIFFPILDLKFFKTGAPIWELYLTAFSILLLIWQNFALNCLFAAKRFIKANIYLNAANILKTVVILVMTVTHTVSVGAVIFVFGIVGPALFFLLLFMQKKDLVFVLLKSEVKREEFRLGYTFTYFVGSQFYNLGLRMDLFLLSFFRPKTPEIGYYGLSQKIILTIITTIVSITQVLSPSFSKVKTIGEARHQLKVAFFYLLIPAGLFFALFLTPNQVFYLFFTEKFSHTAEITRMLALPFIMNALSSLPMLFLLYTRKRPGYILVSNVVMFLIITIGCYVYIPILGVKAAPMAITAAFWGLTIIQSAAAIYEYGKMRKESTRQAIHTP